jgi:nucleotide-binding universal stress UspA family protein
MTHLSRVLCAVDIDNTGRAVVAHALALARRSAARLQIVHAARPDVPFNRDAVERVDYLSRLRASAEAAGVESLVSVQRGDPAEIILLHARARRADLVVIGGRRTRRGLGSVAERVARDAPCPTLVVPATAESVPAARGTVVCGVDFSPASDAAARAAVRMTEGGSHVVLLHVAIGDSDAREALERLQPMSRGRAPVFARVLTGIPVTEIVRTARVTGATLIVIGVRPRGGLARRLFGRTGLLLRDAPCPVLLVPAPDAAAAGEPDAAPRVA